MKTLVPLLLFILLTGCATGPAGGTATRTISAPASALATVSGDPEGATTDFMGGEIHCHVQSIDGDTSNVTATLAPGMHTVIAVLTSQGQQYVGVVQVGLPEARAYRMHAHRRNDAITVTLVDETDKLVATSTAALAAQMKFNVFVKQI
jgi:hypothetical protein